MINKLTASPFISHAKGFLKKEYIRLIIIALIAIFALAPLLSLFFSLSADDFVYMFHDRKFYFSILYSLLYSMLGAGIAVLISLFTAYFLSRAQVRYKKIIVLILTLPMLVPSLSIGLGIKTFLGTSGLLYQMCGIAVDSTGFHSLILSSIVLAFPTSFLILYDALQYENRQVYDAAKTMAISPIRQFFGITIPYLRTPLISAFFASMSLIFSDYGLPMEVAGTIDTLPMYLYEQINSTYEYGRAAIVGFFLLLPAIASFVLDILSKENTSEEHAPSSETTSRLFNILSLIGIFFVAFLLFIPQLSFILLAFFKKFPTDMSFTLDNFANLFASRNGPGIGRYLANSLEIAFLVGIFGTIFSYLTAYFTTRVSGKTGRLIHFASLSSIAIPGIVLGIGYITLFKGTHGFFYGTMAILVVVNIVHFFGSPYLLARDCFAKMNKEYEQVGASLGLSRTSIFFRVLVPNSISTLIEMFSYFFVNSMVTISAVSFLCRYVNQPLAVLITNYEKTGNYEMQAVISLVILAINVIAKFSFACISHFVNKASGKEKKDIMALTRFQFDLLTYIEKREAVSFNQRQLSDDLKVSVSALLKEIKNLSQQTFIQVDMEKRISLTEQGLKALEPYRVKRAIIIAAGFGSRMAPVTLETPKPLVKIHGKRIIETLLDALIEKGITDIVIVRGYKKNQFDDLKERYPTLTFLDNTEFNTTNNISSMMRAIDYIDSCYICEADLYISNPELIRKYEYTTNYLGAKVNETDDWCFFKKGRYVGKYQMGGEDCYQAFGISFWNESDSEKLRYYLPKVYHSRAGKEHFWEAVVFRSYRKKFKVEIRSCHKSDIVEIDNFSELVALDDSYANYPKHEEF